MQKLPLVVGQKAKKAKKKKRSSQLAGTVVGTRLQLHETYISYLPLPPYHSPYPEFKINLVQSSTEFQRAMVLVHPQTENQQ